MKKVKITALLLATLLTGGAAYANTPTLFGLVPGASSFTTDDMLNYSMNSGAFNTARSSAMGCAFTSLGGDLASIGINPAGLGMYRTSAWGFSPSMTWTGMNNDFRSQTNDNNASRFAMNNVGVVLNLSQRSSGVVSFSMGFSYNKAADFNFSSSYELPGSEWSVNDIFAMQLNGLGSYMGGGDWVPYTANEIRPPLGSSQLGVWEWGAGLAKSVGAITTVPDSGDPSTLLYRVGSIGSNGINIVPVMQYDSRGSIGEYNISGGMNINNILYLGFGVTMQDIYQRQQIGYTEFYDYESHITPTSAELDYLDYDQYVTTRGVGVNFKLGMIVRPIPALRLGLAVHTPTYVTLDHEYQAGMQAAFYDRPGSVGTLSTTNKWQYTYQTPTRLLAGASLTLGNFAILSADYERIYYNKMKLTSEDRRTRELYNNDIKGLYRATNNYRFGVEIKPVQMLSLRAGYSFYDSPMKSADIDMAERFTSTTSQNISAGIGFRLGRRSTLDLAYVYSLTKYNSLVTYLYEGEEFLVHADGTYSFGDKLMYPGYDGDAPSDTFVTNLRQKRHTATASFTFLF